jgi:hypothetical protein
MRVPGRVRSGRCFVVRAVELVVDAVASCAGLGCVGGARAEAARPGQTEPELVELAVVQRRLERSEADLKTARRVIEIQGNVYALLEDLLSKGADDSNEPRRPQ